MLPASKRRHKLRPISIGLSVSLRDFIRNPSAGISIRNLGCRICVEILAAPPLRSISAAGVQIARCGFLHTQHPSGEYCTGNTVGNTQASIAQKINREVLHGKHTGFHNTAVCVVGWEHLGIGVKIGARWEFLQQLPTTLTHTDAQLTLTFCKLALCKTISIVQSQAM